MAIIGGASLPLLPVGLELAVEVTRNAAASSAFLFFAGNGLGVVFLVIEDALRDGPDAKPPNSMKRAIIFQGVFVLAVCLTVVGIRGTQTRRVRDEAVARGEDTTQMSEIVGDPKENVSSKV